jgi:hypothetical protein
MNGILRLQVISFISRILAMLIGIFQSLIIVNLLTKEAYGLIGLVASIAGIVGITQHLGLASSSTKEISQAKNDQEIFKVILSSLSIRMFISLPISLILIFFAPQIGSYYNNSEIILPLRIFGLITLIQAFQSIFNSVISGTQRFKFLFSYQVLIALVSLIVFLPLIYFYNLLGYFYALLIFNTIQTLVLGFFSIKELDFKFELPSKREFFDLSIKLLKVSLAIYVVKIIFTAWQEIPVAYLGKVISLETLALFTFAFNLSSKLMSISDSITDVNLPVFSKKSHEVLADYFIEFSKNFNLLYYFIFICGISVAYWSKEVLIGADYFISFIGFLVGIVFDKNIYLRYSDSLVLFLPLLLSIIFYSYINIIKSSFFVPLEKLKSMILTYIVLIFTSMFSYLVLNKYFTDILSMSYALLIGSFLSFLLSVFFIYRVFKYNIFDFSKILFTLTSILVGIISYFIEFDLYSKMVIYVFYILLIFYLFRVNLTVLFKKK